MQTVILTCGIISSEGGEVFRVLVSGRLAKRVGVLRAEELKLEPRPLLWLPWLLRLAGEPGT